MQLELRATKAFQLEQFSSAWSTPKPWFKLCTDTDALKQANQSGNCQKSSRWLTLEEWEITCIHTSSRASREEAKIVVPWTHLGGIYNRLYLNAKRRRNRQLAEKERKKTYRQREISTSISHRPQMSRRRERSESDFSLVDGSQVGSRQFHAGKSKIGALRVLNLGLLR